MTGHYETIVRLTVFLVVLGLMAGWEVLAPRRTQALLRGPRWRSNLELSALNALLLRFGMPLVAIQAAMVAANHDWGLFNLFAAPAWLALPVSIVLLDLTVYFQHRLFHRLPLFWRLHRMHHADLEMDTTTGVRFHPFEALVSMVIKLSATMVLGAPVLAVLIFEILLNASSLFNHGNVRMPRGLDRRLRWLLVTPDMHRVHHSASASEMNRNFGFNLAWWDRLFGTYQDQPQAGHERMTIGLERYRDPTDQRLTALLRQPFSA